jgi:hypothetical protein
MLSQSITVALGMVLACAFVAAAGVFRASPAHFAKGVQDELEIVRPVAGSACIL